MRLTLLNGVSSHVTDYIIFANIQTRISYQFQQSNIHNGNMYLVIFNNFNHLAKLFLYVCVKYFHCHKKGYGTQTPISSTDLGLRYKNIREMLFKPITLYVHWFSVKICYVALL